MRILFITDGFPFPLTSGYLRHYHLIRVLSEKHDITLFSAVDASFKPAHAEAMASYTSRVMTFMSKATKSKSLYRRAVKWVRTLMGSNHTLIQMRDAFKKLMDEEKFDVVILSGEYTYHVIRGIDTPPVISDLCDAYSLRTKGRMKHASPLSLVTLWIKYFDLKRLELKVIEKAKYILFASQRDAVIVPEQFSNKSVILPNGVDTDYWRRTSTVLGGNTIIFTGAMHYPPNNDAALYLISDILPIVKKSFPGLKTLIVGHSPSEKLVEVASQQEGVTVTGFVDDMRPYLEQATLFAAPLRFGSGIQNKVLEALAMELPIVGTSIAADGLYTAASKAPPVRVADTTEEFAQMLVKELTACAQNPAPFTEGREFVEQNFVWASSIAKLEVILDEMSDGASYN
jgi:glycosyltransferase involved in cell wall biosynthesis